MFLTLNIYIYIYIYRERERERERGREREGRKRRGGSILSYSPSFSLSLSLSIYLSIYLFIYLSIYLSICAMASSQLDLQLFCFGPVCFIISDSRHLSEKQRKFVKSWMLTLHTPWYPLERILASKCPRDRPVYFRF